VRFLGQLKYHEDSLAHWLKLLAKKDPKRLRDIFTSTVDGWTPLHACTLRGARKLVKVRLAVNVTSGFIYALLLAIHVRSVSVWLAIYVMSVFRYYMYGWLFMS
jgi:hypothetical protein